MRRILAREEAGGQEGKLAEEDAVQICQKSKLAAA
jgi:hypothetical protein